MSLGFYSQAATQGGFSILRLIPEPCAALLAYDIGQTEISPERLRTLVLRLGGRSMSASVVDVIGGMYRVEADATFSSLGGHEMDSLMVRHLAEDFNRQHRCRCLDNQRCVFKLSRAARNTRHVLSSLSSAHCSVESLYDGTDLNTSLSR